mgnify:CR=1 FL=1
MKITKLETFVVAPRWLFLKVSTDEGISGWGEPVLEGHAETLAAKVRELETLLIGRDPLLIEDTWQMIYRNGCYRGGPVLMSAMSGVDMALWDIKGKSLGQPVHALMGGKVRDKVRTYRWIGGDRPDNLVADATALLDAGYDACKLNATEEVQFLDSYSLQVDRHGLFPEGLVDGKRFMPLIVGGVVDENGDRAVCLRGCSECSLKGCQIADVSGEEQRTPAGLPLHRLAERRGIGDPVDLGVAVEELDLLGGIQLAGIRTSISPLIDRAPMVPAGSKHAAPPVSQRERAPHACGFCTPRSPKPHAPSFPHNER